MLALFRRSGSWSIGEFTRRFALSGRPRLYSSLSPSRPPCDFIVKSQACCAVHVACVRPTRPTHTSRPGLSALYHSEGWGRGGACAVHSVREKLVTEKPERAATGCRKRIANSFWSSSEAAGSSPLRERRARPPPLPSTDCHGGRWERLAGFLGTLPFPPPRKQDWVLKCLQGGRAHPLAACAVATLCLSLPSPL
jgi:hypothetical protein